MNINIRDKRNKGWFFLDNEYLNGYAKIFGGVGTAIYVSLCRHADAEQKCFPSQELIGEELDVAPRTVRKYIKMFKEWNLLKVHRKKTGEGKWLNNVYYLLDKSEWKKPEETDAHGNQRQMTTIPEENNSKNQRQQLPTKDTNIKKTNIKNTKEPTPRQFAKKFFNESVTFRQVVSEIIEETGAPEKLIESEIGKFLSYWTEPNGSGTKQRWELQRTFDVRRRIGTWLRNASRFNKSDSHKGIMV